jgi:hypothetical protein
MTTRPRAPRSSSTRATAPSRRRRALRQRSQRRLGRLRSVLNRAPPYVARRSSRRRGAPARVVPVRAGCITYGACVCVSSTESRLARFSHVPRIARTGDRERREATTRRRVRVCRHTCPDLPSALVPKDSFLRPPKRASLVAPRGRVHPKTSGDAALLRECAVSAGRVLRRLLVPRWLHSRRATESEALEGGLLVRVRRQVDEVLLQLQLVLN